MSVVTKADLVVLRKGGQITAKTISTLFKEAKVGTKLSDLEHRAQEIIASLGAKPSFTTVSGYPYATCINVNSGVVHGVPSGYSLSAGDVLSIDLGVIYQGFHTDSAWTSVVGGKTTAETANFLAVGEKALYQAISVARVGNFVGDISRTITNIVEGSGYNVSKDLVGHGIGRELHEDPQIPGFPDPSSDNLPLLDHQALAIEVIYMQGKSPIVVDPKDRWTISTRDGSMAALFEHSLVVTNKDPIVLTKDD